MSNLVLMNFGNVLEYFLTHEKNETKQILEGKAEKQDRNYYRYANVNNEILLRSQIDCRSVDKDGNDYVF